MSSNKVEIMGSLARDALSATAKKIGGGWFDVTVFGIAPLVGTVMCVVLCRRRRRRRLVVCFLPGFGGALFFYAGEVSSFAGGVVSLPFLSLPSVVPPRRLSARREAGK